MASSIARSKRRRGGIWQKGGWGRGALASSIWDAFLGSAHRKSVRSGNLPDNGRKCTGH